MREHVLGSPVYSIRGGLINLIQKVLPKRSKFDERICDDKRFFSRINISEDGQGVSVVDPLQVVVVDQAKVAVKTVLLKRLGNLGLERIIQYDLP